MLRSIHIATRSAAALFVVGLLALAPAAQAQVTVGVTGNVATAQVALPGGLGATFTMTFDGAQNLSVPSLGVGARVVTPSELAARLPSGVALPAAFPVMISVEPPALGGLQFRNAVGVEIHTENLVFVDGSPFRLYKAPKGGQFYDITDDVLAGSVRTRGRTGDYSDFLIVIDLATDAADAAAKYDFLEARLAHPSVAAAARTALLADLAASRSAFAAADYAGAAAALAAFDTRLASLAGTGVPNVWRSTRDLANVAGELMSESGALRFTLGRLAN